MAGAKVSLRFIGESAGASLAAALDSRSGEACKMHATAPGPLPTRGGYQ